MLSIKQWVSTGLLLLAAAGTQANVAQTPLLLGGGNVPGNLVLTPSVEFPTVISQANLGNYDLNATYAGYFDSDKCYEYKPEVFTHVLFGQVTTTNGGGYFKPINFNFKDKKNCGGKWSGHYLNWAATQTIDPFRKALTGGYRVVDSESQTILEKATRHNRGQQYFEEKKLNNSDVIKKVTPFTSQQLSAKVGEGATEYQKNKTIKINNMFYSVRVEVCVKGLLEENCKQYGNNYKPEGLLQEYSDEIRYSVFSYLNIDGNGVDGGVLRAQQDYIGPKKRVPGVPGLTVNSNSEWDPETGVLYKDPHSSWSRNEDAKNHSGVINYINKFGEISGQLKSNDPVSELYYAAIRYLRAQGNLADYTSQANTALKRDYFPVITNWNDPIQYSCQKNAILGIGDVNTHEDKNLLPADDRFMALNEYTQTIFDLESINKSANAGSFNGNGNSAYIAGLAYWANINDIRPDWAGKQTVSTYWVDVRENRELKGKSDNQYWLTAKYGGFDVPNGYQYGTPLRDEWWHTSGEVLSTHDKRPDNFFVASDADAMVQSLRQAFAKIASNLESSTAALAANSSRLETGLAVFQSKLNSRYWSGDLVALEVKADGSVEEDEAWSAAEKLDALSDAQLDNRKIFTVQKNDDTEQNILTKGTNFTWRELNAAQKEALSGQDVLQYLRGERSKEHNSSNPQGKFRERGGRLGDIVNSDPQYVNKQSYGYHGLTHWQNSIAQKYTEFRNTQAYKERVPMVIVGANDGMLHAFDARLEGGGEELFAFVPNAVYSYLKELSEPNYTHRYFVDGVPTVGDAWLSNKRGDNKWSTVVVGTTGAGGNSVFALDITNVKDKSSMNANRVMWEFTHEKLGYTVGQASLVALANQKFGVIFSSGYHNSAPDEGYVWILDVATGKPIKQFKLPTTGNLGTVLATDLNGNGEADRLYVADTNGQVWRIDIDNDNPDLWGIPSTLDNGKGPLFKVKDAEGRAQAITAPLSSAFNAKGQHMIVFGTGSYYRVGDNEVPDNPPVESLYGLVDSGQLIDGRSALLQQHIILERESNGQLLRAVSKNPMTDQAGWFLDLAWYAAQGGQGGKGERVLARASLRSGRALFTTMMPVDDPCVSGGTSMIMALDLAGGSRLDNPYFDINFDGSIDQDDNLPAGDISDMDIPWSGITNPDDGVIKGVTTMYQWICYGGSSGEVKCIPVAGSTREGRQSWREVRGRDE